jgi:excisionase family DNA binding protein|nr:MAG TPA: helix-turn-helix domain protein [Caudoviricetes sp.]DAT49933.1 MAG TPA: helix-turn-helix domain protein [Caudoviricetes sp.]
MTNEEPKVADAGRYTMTETCKALGIHRNTLRRWVQAGKMKVKFRRIDNRKVIDGAEIKRAWRVAL